MLWKLNVDRQIKEIELRSNPVIVRVNKFDEESAKDFATFMENLYEGVIKEMEEFIANSGIAVSVEAKKLATEDLRARQRGRAMGGAEGNG